MEVTYHRCVGLDVHKKTVVACTIIPSADAKALETCRTFGTFSRDLLMLSDWLTS